MADLPSTPPTDREAAIARAKALHAPRQNSDAPAVRKTKSSTGSRILVAGVAASSGILMVGAMAAAANGANAAAPAPAQQVVERVVVIEVPAESPAPVGTAVDPTAPATAQEVQVIKEVRVVPAPPQSPATAPAPTAGS